MQVTIYENEYGLSIDIEPETVEQAMKFLRYINNAKAEKPEVTFYFSSDKPNLSIWLKKVKKSVQFNHVRK